MTIRRFADYPYPNSIEDINSVADYLKKLHSSLQGESTERIMDFDILRLTNVPWVDVRAYGAKGDDSTDDTKAIQAAFDYVGQGGLVFFPEGTYKITSAITLNTNVHVMGAGWHSKIKQYTADTDCFDTTVSESQIIVENLYLYGNSTSDGFGVRVRNSDDCIIKYCRIDNFYDGIYFGPDSSDRNIAIGNWCISNKRQGITAGGGGFVRIISNRCVSNTLNGIDIEGTDVHSIIAMGNVCDSNGTNGITSVSTTSGRHIIGLNECYNNTEYGIQGDGKKTTVIGNVCRENGKGGLYVPGEDSSIMGNISESNLWMGIHLKGDRISCIGNICKDNNTDDTDDAEKSGIYIEGSDNSTLMGNICHGATQKYGISIANNCTKVRLQGNELDGNKTANIYDLGSSTRVNQQGSESANAETPTAANWDIGDIVDFTDTGDGSGDGVYLKLKDGSWSQIGT